MVWGLANILYLKIYKACKRHSRVLSESRRDQEEGGELDSHAEVRLICGSRRDQDDGSGAGPSSSAQKRSRAGRWSWAQKVGLRLLRLFLSSNATDIVFVTLLRTAVETVLCSTLAAMQWRWGTALTFLLFWRRSTASSVFRVGARGPAFTFFPFPSVPVKVNMVLTSTETIRLTRDGRPRP